MLLPPKLNVSFPKRWLPVLYLAASTWQPPPGSPCSRSNSRSSWEAGQRWWAEQAFQEALPKCYRETGLEEMPRWGFLPHMHRAMFQNGGPWQKGNITAAHKDAGPAAWRQMSGQMDGDYQGQSPLYFRISRVAHQETGLLG